MPVKKLIWTMLGLNSIKSKSMVIETSIPKPHTSEHYINSFPLYISGQLYGTGQYISSIINLDFDQLIKLREKLFIEYGYHFLESALLRKMNKQIYILNEWALSKMLGSCHSNDLDYLNNKKEYISKLLKENNERLDQLKFKYVISLYGNNLDLFNAHFYTYSKLYEYVLGDINTRIFMFTYHYDKKTGTFPTNYKVLLQDTNNEKLIPIEVQESTIIFNRLTSPKSYEEIHTLITFLATDYEGKKKWIAIEMDKIEDFIHGLFNFGETPKLHPTFDITVTGALWACLIHELKIKGYIKGTNKNLSDILSAYFQKSLTNKITKSTFLVYLSDSRRRNNVKEDNEYIPFDIVASFLK